MKILWKILRSNVSITQFSGFFIANLIGLTIVLAGLRFKEDLTPIFNQGDSFLKDDYMVVSKRVTALNTLAISNSGFSLSFCLHYFSKKEKRKRRGHHYIN